MLKIILVSKPEYSLKTASQGSCMPLTRESESSREFKRSSLATRPSANCSTNLTKFRCPPDCHRSTKELSLAYKKLGDNFPEPTKVGSFKVSQQIISNRLPVRLPNYNKLNLTHLQKPPSKPIPKFLVKKS